MDREDLCFHDEKTRVRCPLRADWGQRIHVALVHSPDSALSADVNECLNNEICSPNGECLNSHGSYFCICAPGFSNVAGGVSCQGELESSRDICPCPLLPALL